MTTAILVPLPVLVRQYSVTTDLADTLRQTKPDVVVDFTSPFTVMQNIATALSLQVRPVVGTTGITEADIEKIREWSAQYQTPAVIAPNFAIGAVLMMQFAAQAAKFLPEAEIIELHHERKIDAPSGTAIKTAEMMLKARGQALPRPVEEMEKIAGARGGSLDGIHIHSVFAGSCGTPGSYFRRSRSNRPSVMTV